MTHFAVRLKWQYFAAGVGILALWMLLYTQNAKLAWYITHELFGLAPATDAAKTVNFFFYDTVKILLLLVLMVYVLAWLRAGLRLELVRDRLQGSKRILGYVLGAVFGAITPFCSCSSIPLFLGFTMAGIPIGITMAFLITSPLINEVAVVLLAGILGVRFTVIYIISGLIAGILGGLFMDLIHAERWLEPKIKAYLGATRASVTQAKSTLSFFDRHEFARAETKSILQRIWYWVVIGVGIGAVIHGYVPATWLTKLGTGDWWSVPAAVAVGIPLYTNVTGIVPILESLITKGVPIGTAMAFCMSTVGASLPEFLLLKQVMLWQLLAIFFGVLLILFTIIGWLLLVLL